MIGPGFVRIPVPSRLGAVMVPRVLGLCAADAELTLLARKFHLSLRGPADGYVIEQNPGPEAPAAFESAVELALAPIGFSS